MDDGFLNVGLLNSHTPSATVPSSNGRGVFFMVLDSATSPFGFAQNDKDGFSNDRNYYLLKVKYSY